MNTSQVMFQFDEPTNDEMAYAPANFLALTQEGDLVEGRFFVEVGEIGDDNVTITFDSNIVAAADTYLMRPDAVEDYPGQRQPRRARVARATRLPSGPSRGQRL
jgi:hypothetical protein